METVPEPPVRVIAWHPTRRTYHQFATEALFFRWAVDNLRPTVGAGVHYVDLNDHDVRVLWAVPDDNGRWVLTDSGAKIVAVAPVEPLTTRRQRMFASTIEEHLVRVDTVDLHLLDVDAWAALPPRPHHAYGYLSPVNHADRIEMWCCPALMDAQTAHLDDSTVEEYAVTVAMRLVRELGCIQQDRTDTEIVAIVDEYLELGLPDGWQIVQLVETRAVNKAAAELLDGLR